MYILTAAQIRQWDHYTIQKRGINAADLMEAAATECFRWLVARDFPEPSFTIYCGKGNNGGDGLALARLLTTRGWKTTVCILESGYPGTEDFQTNLMRLHETPAGISFIQQEGSIHPVPENDIVIDALFGLGLNRPLEGIAAQLVRHINSAPNEVLAIDIPSGMFADKSSVGNEMIRANHTLSFQIPKLAFLVPENAAYTGRVNMLDIGLIPAFLQNLAVTYEMLTPLLVKDIYKPRDRYGHKGTYGHAALIAGSGSMMGAAVLAAKACMRSGAGKLTCYIPDGGYNILQIAVPEAIIQRSGGEAVEPFTPAGEYNAIGIGPGLGRHDSNSLLLARVFEKGNPLVIDADALNTLAEQGTPLLHKIPPFSILTPHLKEFERLFGKTKNDFDRLEMAKTRAAELNVIILLKGHHSFVAMPGGKAYFNATGNPGMATAGSGDVLTGILTGLLAQGYTPEKAALLGVYLHGLAGDIAASRKSQEAMIASDITEHIGEAFLQLIKP